MRYSGIRQGAYVLLGLGALAAPMVFPAYQAQLAVLWLMVVLALTWDIMGGQMGYNSFGNIVYFGLGMYVTAVVQRDLFFDVEEYAAVAGGIDAQLSVLQYFAGLSLGLLAATVVCVLVAALLGSGILGLRGHYFAICTLGLGVAAGEIASGMDYVGAGSGLVTPLYPADADSRGAFFYFYFLALATITLLTLRGLYARRFGLAINSIRDNEDKAEAMGLQTTRYKTMAWCISAFFLALAGGAYGNLIGFIDPIDVAFAGSTLGVWMVLMAILGGKGTLWGPVIGAAIFHLTQEIFWTYLLGWQRVALGFLIIVIVVFFPRGILGWFRERRHRYVVAQDASGDPA
ncbi:MAG: branched-chain amino acid ABC transporter permease [Gammaproteobacteria bacterium]|nr:branched-chain amino acid ABC transporter permease [Gammaproteobacteria bacterium]